MTTKREALAQKRHSRRVTTLEEQELERFAPKEGKLSERQMQNAQRAIYSLLKAVEELEVVVARDQRHIELKINGRGLEADADWVIICRALARNSFKRVKYWQFWAERYFDLDDTLKARMERVFIDYHQFAGDGAE